MHYYARVGNGPIGDMYPDLADYGGIGFWATYFSTYGAVAPENIFNSTIGLASDYVANDPTTPAQIAALIPQLLAAGECSDPVGDCVVVAQTVLTINAAALPQIAGAGAVAGVAQSIQ